MGVKWILKEVSKTRKRGCNKISVANNGEKGMLSI